MTIYSNTKIARQNRIECEWNFDEVVGFEFGGQICFFVQISNEKQSNSWITEYFLLKLKSFI